MMNDKTVFNSTMLNHYESGRKNVGIFELADLLGVTAEALRKYETREIIQPIRDERGYRKFHSWDLTKIIYARQLKQEGFSLNDIADTMKNNNAGEQVDGIETLQKKLALEIQYRKKLIHWLSAQKDEVLRSEQVGERCVIEWQPALLCCVYMVNDTLVDKTGEAREHLKQWLQALPFCSIYYIGSPENRVVSCLVLSEEEIRRYQLDHLAADFVIPEHLCAICYSKAEHDPRRDTSIDNLRKAQSKLKDLNMEFEDYVITRMIRYVQRDDWYMSVNKICFPIAGKP